LLGVKFPSKDFTRQKIKQKLIEGLRNSRAASNLGQAIFVVTLNPEILLLAGKDWDYQKVLNRADLPVIDGFGIQLVAWLRGLKIGQRWAGADLAEEVLSQAERRGLKVTLIVRKGGLSKTEEVLEATRTRFPQLNLAVLVMMPQSDWSQEELQRLAKSPELKDTEVLLVGLGAPFQERLIDQIREYLPRLRLALGVGGSFDFWTGKQRRAPGWLRVVGLEWLWRIVSQPENRRERAKRAFRAVVVFPVVGLWEGLKNVF